MSYIPEESRERLRRGGTPQAAQELAYVLTRDVDDYLHRYGRPRFVDHATVIGTLLLVLLEVWRRRVLPYEVRKRELNGDVFE